MEKLCRNINGKKDSLGNNKVMDKENKEWTATSMLYRGLNG